MNQSIVIFCHVWEPTWFDHHYRDYSPLNLPSIVIAHLIDSPFSVRHPSKMSDRLTTRDLSLPQSTVRVDSLPHRKWKEIKQQPGTAGPGNMLGCCLISFHFLWGKPSTLTVETANMIHRFDSTTLVNHSNMVEWHPFTIFASHYHREGSSSPKFCQMETSENISILHRQ